MVRIRYADQKLLCLQWKCGLGLKMTLSVDARRGSAPCRWAFPGVLFIIKKMLERNFGNFEKKIILTTKTIPTMQRNKKTFKRQNIYIGICPQQTKRTVPLVWEFSPNLMIIHSDNGSLNSYHYGSHYA